MGKKSTLLEYKNENLGQIVKITKDGLLGFGTRSIASFTRAPTPGHDASTNFLLEPL